MIIGNFKSKKELQDVVRILRNNGIIYAFHKEMTYSKMIDEVYDYKYYLSIWNREDNGKQVFSFSDSKTHRKLIKASDFILDNKSTKWLVLNALMTTKNNYCTLQELKKLLKGRSNNALFQAILELKQDGCIIGKSDNNEYYMIHKPDTMVLGFSKVYTGMTKLPSREESREELLSLSLIDKNKLAQQIMDKVGFDNTEKTFIESLELLTKYWLDKIKKLWK